MAFSPGTIDEVGVREAMKPLVDELVGRGGEPAVSAGEDAVTRVRFTLGDVPFELAMVARLYQADIGGFIRFAVGTRVSRLVPDLVITTANALTPIASAVGLLTDRVVGDDYFDASFRVDCPEAVVGLLGPAVRRPLLALDGWDRRLDVRDHVARVAWNGAARTDTLDAAISALSALREASTRLR
jgi:hypothetical protein